MFRGIKDFGGLILLGCSVLLYGQNVYAQEEAQKAQSPEGKKVISPDELYDKKPSTLKGRVGIRGDSAYIYLPPPDYEGDDNRLRGMLRQQLPLTPEQIRMIKRETLKREIAKWDTVFNPSIQTKSMMLDISPGARLPIVKLTPGFVSTLVFIDAAGNPWPLSSPPIIGNPNLIQAIVPENKSNNVIVLNALKPSGLSNISIMLKGQDAPVIIKLDNNVKKHYARVDFSVNGYVEGGNVKIMGKMLPSGTVESDMMKFVTGAPVEGAKRLRTNDRSVRAWKKGNYLYLRMRHKLVSPGWISEVAGVGGLKVYKLPYTSRLLYMVEGEIKNLNVRAE